jgi:multiple sugar transport system substrate-binding protein
MAWDECAKHYADGNSVMVMSWSSRAYLFELNKNSPAYLNTGYLPLPAAKKDFQLSPIGGFSFGIPKQLDSDRINICLKIIKHLISPQVIKYYIEQGSLSCPLFSVSHDPEVKRISSIFENIDKMEKDGKIVQWPRIAVPQYSKMANIIGNELFNGVFLSMNIEEALNNAQIKVEKLFN